MGGWKELEGEGAMEGSGGRGREEGEGGGRGGREGKVGEGERGGKRRVREGVIPARMDREKWVRERCRKDKRKKKMNDEREARMREDGRREKITRLPHTKNNKTANIKINLKRSGSSKNKHKMNN